MLAAELSKADSHPHFDSFDLPVWRLAEPLTLISLCSPLRLRLTQSQSSLPFLELDLTLEKLRRSSLLS